MTDRTTGLGPACVNTLYRYPVKGLSPQPVQMAELQRGAFFPGDRIYAIENGPSGFDPATPAFQPKSKFLMLMRDERLATLRTHYDDASNTLTIRDANDELLRADVTSAEGRDGVEAFFRAFMTDSLRGRPRILRAPKGFRFTDSTRGFVSIINLASVAAIENLVEAPVDPLRFRGNLYVAGWPAWHEFDVIGQEIMLGSAARLRITKRILRCAATNVDPHTGARDLAIPQALLRGLGHSDCGVYAEVIRDGPVAIGDHVTPIAPAQQKLPF